MDRYEKIEKNGGGNLGEGTYGVVYKAKDRQTEEIVALKVKKREEASRLYLLDYFQPLVFVHSNPVAYSISISFWLGVT